MNLPNDLMDLDRSHWSPLLTPPDPLPYSTIISVYVKRYERFQRRLLVVEGSSDIGLALRELGIRQRDVPFES